MEALIDSFGEEALMCALGGFVGLVFGVAAARSRFCLRAATAELAQLARGPRLAVWLVALGFAVFAVQLSILAGVLETSSARQLAATGSISGAIVGGLTFGTGMILARGCVSRLLVLSASGNLRAIVTGLVVTLTAQAALRGVLSGPRTTLASLWTVPGGEERNLMAMLELSVTSVAILAGIGCVLALAFGFYHKVKPVELLAAAMVGLAVCAGWIGTFAVASNSFELVNVQSVTFTGPSTDTLMALVNAPDVQLSFGLGLVPGVFLGALLAALLMGEARIQRFGPDTPMERYLVGGVLMGFGSMLAGGCAVGAGMAGGSILALTAWVAVFFMWVGAVTTQRLMDRLPALRTA